MDNNIISIEDQEIAQELETDAAADYTHTFAQPFEWMGQKYETLSFHFSKLKGKDALAIYNELQMKGVMVLSARTSQQYQMHMAAKACGLGVDAFDEMSFRDFEVILSKTRNFIPAAALI